MGTSGGREEVNQPVGQTSACLDRTFLYAQIAGGERLEQTVPVGAGKGPRRAVHHLFQHQLLQRERTSAREVPESDMPLPGGLHGGGGNSGQTPLGLCLLELRLATPPQQALSVCLWAYRKQPKTWHESRPLGDELKVPSAWGRKGSKENRGWETCSRAGSYPDWLCHSLPSAPKTPLPAELPLPRILRVCSTPQLIHSSGHCCIFVCVRERAPAPCDLTFLGPS